MRRELKIKLMIYIIHGLIYIFYILAIIMTTYFSISSVLDYHLRTKLCEWRQESYNELNINYEELYQKSKENFTYFI